MTSPSNSRTAAWLPAGVCAAAALAVFHFCGNATRGYIDSASVFAWWGRQWFDAGAEAQHGPLVVLIAVWLGWRGVRKVESLELRAESRNLGGRSGATGEGAEDGETRAGRRGRAESRARVLAVAAMAGGLGLHVLGYAVQQTRISCAACLVFLWGALVLGGGRRWAGATVFPVAFLVFAIPVNFLDSLGFHLRMGVVATVHALGHAVGIDVVRNGTQLFAPDGHYQYDVAAACSGVRSLVALIALSVLIGYLNFRSWAARAAVALLCLPFVFAGNVLRIGVIVLVGEWRGHAAGERLHAWSGALVFVAVLGLLYATVALLRRWGVAAVEMRGDAPMPAVAAGRADGATATGAATTMAAVGTSGRTIWAGAATVILAAMLVIAAVRRLDALPVRSTAGVRLEADGVNPAELPFLLGSEWAGRLEKIAEVEREILPKDTGYSRKNYVRTGRPEEQVLFSVILSGRDRSSIHRPELCLLGQGWSVAARDGWKFNLPAGGDVPATLLRVERVVVASDGTRRVAPALLAYWFVGGDGGDVVATHGGMLWRNAMDRLRTFRADRWAYVVVQTLALDGEEAAKARLADVAGRVWGEVRD